MKTDDKEMYKIVTAEKCECLEAGPSWNLATTMMIKHFRLFFISNICDMLLLIFFRMRMMLFFLKEQSQLKFESLCSQLYSKSFKVFTTNLKYKIGECQGQLINK